ncbi:unnamed protein product [Acanthoscelides obtectus]|uniref:DDE Tnp4 domain-containing protein n=1 Tax=Acanthoscelides obtectus TaxID=200917 RepID=A0A9P0PBV1_ACAOB|nr:unnamed protein product [Acanthoscelides obtectus]CAK1624773.1 hypothetical protein AOBTE_LOCUS2756 [Acanthoscelides obtectus]
MEILGYNQIVHEGRRVPMNALSLYVTGSHPKEYRMTLRMTAEKFDYLLGLITPLIQREDTITRDAIKLETMLEVTLNYLKLVPDTHDAWKKVANGFKARWNFPFCCGAIDGKHVLIEAPPHTGSKYFNYKGSFSVVLMAIVEHNYCSAYFKVGTKGSNSDGSIFQSIEISGALEEGLLPNGYFLVVKVKMNVSSVNKLVSAAIAIHNWLRKTSPDQYFDNAQLVDCENQYTGKIIPGQWRQEIRELRNIREE